MPEPTVDLKDGVIRLRPWELSDVEAVRAASEEGRIPEGTTVPREFTVEEGEAFVRRQHGRLENGEGWSFAIADAATDKAVGCIVLLHRPQSGVAGIGYWLVPGARRRGLATRAVRLLTEWALGPAGLARVEAWVEPGNVRSIHVLDRCGFVLEGRLRSFLSFESRRADALVFSKVEGDRAPDPHVGLPAIGGHARLIVVCGLPGTGKTSHALEIERVAGAIRFSADDWMDDLGCDLWDEDMRARIEALQWRLAQRLLKRSLAVVIEWGTWGRDEREALRSRARELGATVELHYLHAPVDTLDERIQSRARESPAITRSQLATWADQFETPDEAERESWDIFLEVGPDAEEKLND